MNVGVRARLGVAAVLATTTGPGVRAGAHNALAEPEGEALFAYTAWAVEEQGARKGAALQRVVEARTKGGMTVNREEGHS